MDVIDHAEDDDELSEILSALEILRNLDLTSNSAEHDNTASVRINELQPPPSDHMDSSVLYSMLQQVSSDALECYNNSRFAFLDPNFNGKALY